MGFGVHEGLDSLVAVEVVSKWQTAMQPLWSDTNKCWCSSDISFYLYEYKKNTLRKVFRLPKHEFGVWSRIKEILARSWMRRRFFPGAAVDALVELPSGDVVVIYDKVYWYSHSNRTELAEVLPFSGEPILAPPLRCGSAVHGKSSHVYFGEYLNGRDRPIRIARVDTKQKRVDVCWTFSATEIKHIHSIHYDEYRNRLWICTGDLDTESAFWYTDDEFHSVHRFAGGDQSWRAIALIFDESGMEWGMDAGKDAPGSAINHIYRYDFLSNQRSELAAVGNPVYAGCKIGEQAAVFQASFEPGRRQNTPETTALWLRYKDGSWAKILEIPYRKNRTTWGGQYGALLIPGGTSPEGQLLATPINTSVLQGKMLKLIINCATPKV